MSAAVLIVEDEKHLADGLRFNLEAEGYRVETVSDGESALSLLMTAPEHYDAVILDVMLPGKDGFTIAAELRSSGYFVPILMLTARGRPEDVLRGFESGADDYLAKPFELAILMARLRGLLRRHRWSFNQDHSTAMDARIAEAESGTAKAIIEHGKSAPHAEDEIFAFHGKTIDFGALELRIDDRIIRLTLMEAELLRYLIERAGKAVSRKSMLEEVWGLREDTDTRAIDNFIVRLRKYIEEVPSNPQHLLTVRGVGYRFIPEPINDRK